MLAGLLPRAKAPVRVRWVIVPDLTDTVTGTEILSSYTVLKVLSWLRWAMGVPGAAGFAASIYVNLAGCPSGKTHPISWSCEKRPTGQSGNAASDLLFLYDALRYGSDAGWFLYGGRLLINVVPGQIGISWSSHLGGIVEGRITRMYRAIVVFGSTKKERHILMNTCRQRAEMITLARVWYENALQLF